MWNKFLVGSVLLIDWVGGLYLLKFLWNLGFKKNILNCLRVSMIFSSYENIVLLYFIRSWILSYL